MRPFPHSSAKAIALGSATIVLVLVVGCGSVDECEDSGAGVCATIPASPLSVKVDPASVAPGEAFTAKVVNQSPKDFTYGAAYELEREVDGGWQKVDLPDRAVIQIAYIAKPGETGPPVDARVPGDAEPGGWRIVVARDIRGGGELTGEFEVSDG